MLYHGVKYRTPDSCIFHLIGFNPWHRRSATTPQPLGPHDFWSPLPMRIPPRPRRLLAAVAAAATALVVVPGPSAGAAVAFCGLTGLDKYTWSGPVGGRWDVAANWTNNGAVSSRVPGMWNDLTSENDYVCIPSGKSVVMPAPNSLPDGSFWATLRAIDVGTNATLLVDEGSMLFLEGSQSTHPSFARSGSTVTLRSSTLGGRGKITFNGTLNWINTRGAATMVTRFCDVGAGCDGPLTGAIGRTVIAATGRLNVNSAGVNLEDKRVIENRGLTTVSGTGYIAADYGTSFTNAGGTFDIRNDRGYYQGRQRYQITQRGSFVNTGILRKSAGTGTSVVDAVYSEGSTGAGRIVVQTGQISILGRANDAASNTATVSPGAAFGVGGCDPAASSICTQPVATSADKQVESVALPAGGAVTDVTIEELPSLKTASMRTAPTHITTPSAVASTSNPMTFRFGLDASLVRSGETPLALSQSLAVSRQADDGATPPVPVPNCTGSTPTGSQQSCVDRSASQAATSGAGGDVVLVVRTTQNSRWIVN